MRTRGRTDRNHTDIVRALRQAGCSAVSLASIGYGCPDVLVGYMGTCPHCHQSLPMNMCLEIKDELAKPSERRMTALELEFHERWRGPIAVVQSVTHAFRALGLKIK